MRARQIGFTLIADEILEISDAAKGDFIEDENGGKTVDHEAIARARLRVDSRKWMLSKMLPKIYGDKVVNEVVGRDGGPVEVKAGVDVFLAKIDAIAARQRELKSMAEDEDEKTQKTIGFNQ
jgi:hypothetical protein